MSEINWNEELQKDKYEDVKDAITKLKNYYKSWYDLKNADENTLNIWKIDERYFGIWSHLVEHMEKLDNGTIEIDRGTIIDNDNDGLNQCSLPTNPRSAWQIFKRHLYEKNIYSTEEMIGLEEGTLSILKRLSINTDEPVKGLVMGYVQSGKTTSIESLITMAADNGWNLFIILSGTIENLRLQNLKRLKEDIEYNQNGDIHWSFSPNLKVDNASNLINSNKKVVTVCLKNSTRLMNLKNWIFNESKLELKNMKVLLIDDEADQASIDTKDIEKEERTKINELIVDIVGNENFGAMNYVAYTATPYGNFLNEYGNESLYPKNFIYTLPKSTQYIGAQEIFGLEATDDEYLADGLNIIRTISNNGNNNDIQMIRNIENSISEELPNSLKNAICWFICTVAIFRYRNIVKPVSMLVHTNHKVVTHSKLFKAIKTWLDNISPIDLLKQCEEIYNGEVQLLSVQDFKNVLTSYNRDIEDYPTFEAIRTHIVEIITLQCKFTQINDTGKLKYTRGIHMVVDNCSFKPDKLDDFVRLAYPSKEDNLDYASAFIVVGGNTLSRGLTIEGLTSTYFCRKVTQMDTLMQMGRWFGYRTGYELLPRVWLDERNLKAFTELTQVEYALREDLTKYTRGNSPAEYGPLIKNSYLTKLVITAKNKMQSAIEAEMNYMGAKAQTVLFDTNNSIHKQNIEIVDAFLGNIDGIKEAYIRGNLLKEDLDFEYIKNELLLKFRFCNQSSFFNNIGGFCEWVDKNKDEKLKKWNVIVAGANNQSNGIWNIGEYSVGKISRTRKSTNSMNTYFSIGSLRNTIDILSDVVGGAIPGEKEKDMILRRENINTPQIILYRIDKNSTPSKKLSKRQNLDMQEDVMGMYIYVPGNSYKDYVQTVTIRIPEVEEEEE